MATATRLHSSSSCHHRACTTTYTHEPPIFFTWCACDFVECLPEHSTPHTPVGACSTPVRGSVALVRIFQQFFRGVRTLCVRLCVHPVRRPPHIQFGLPPPRQGLPPLLTPQLGLDPPPLGARSPYLGFSSNSSLACLDTLCAVRPCSTLCSGPHISDSGFLHPGKGFLHPSHPS